MKGDTEKERRASKDFDVTGLQAANSAPPPPPAVDQGGAGRSITRCCITLRRVSL